MNGGIASILVLSLVSLIYTEDRLEIQLRLEKPITREIVKLVDQGYEFKVEFYCSFIINDKRTLRRTGNVSLKKKNDSYFINGEIVEKAQLNEKFGDVKLIIQDAGFKDQDELLFFSKVRILPDETFTQSTGLKTGILWDHYIPKLKHKYIFKNKKLYKQK